MERCCVGRSVVYGQVDCIGARFGRTSFSPFDFVVLGKGDVGWKSSRKLTT